MRSLPRLRALAVVLPAVSLLAALSGTTPAGAAASGTAPADASALSGTTPADASALSGTAPADACALSGDGPVGGPLLTGTGTVLAPGAPALPPQAVAHGLVVADLDTGAVLAARDPHGRYAPASTLKILTAVTLSPLLDRSRKLVPTFDDLNVDGTKVGLVERVGYPVDELFTAMMMVSGNDIANTLASAAGGPAAIEKMNAEAARLQARDTHAVNPSGLDAPGQLSSAYDLALLGRAGLADPDFRRWVSTRRGSVSGPGGKRIETYNHNKLLGRYEGALGIKNGYTSTAKASFVGAATRGGHTVLVSMMRTQPKVDVEARALLDWGFAAIAAGAQPVGTLVEPVDGGLAVASAPPTDSAVLRLPVSTAEEPASGGGLSTPLLTVAGLSALTLLVRRRRRVVLARAAARRA
ncbi:MAG: D-alanyl-D-alanine carboxypeptidase, partial [Frankiales bacterium]|nr:D-alanyl-D-alanine carboxypeptidase [Frankiales bacterium]